jgi:hypothetical protein
MHLDSADSSMKPLKATGTIKISFTFQQQNFQPGTSSAEVIKPTGA